MPERPPSLMIPTHDSYLKAGATTTHTLHYRVLIASKDERLLGCAGPETAKAIISPPNPSISTTLSHITR